MEPQTITVGSADSHSHFYHSSQDFLTAFQDSHLSALKPYDGTSSRAAGTQDILSLGLFSRTGTFSCVLHYPPFASKCFLMTQLGIKQN